MAVHRSALVVGLGGITNGGKTTLCQALERLFSSPESDRRVQSIHLDDYFRSLDDPRHVYLTQFGLQDWDCLNALDTDRFVADLQSARRECDLLLVEGFLIFNIPLALLETRRFDLAYYLDLPYEECRRRRSERAYEPPDPDGYFEGHVWQAYVQAKTEAFNRNLDVQLQLLDTSKETQESIQAKMVKDIEAALKCAQTQL